MVRRIVRALTPGTVLLTLLALSACSSVETSFGPGDEAVMQLWANTLESPQTGSSSMGSPSLNVEHTIGSTSINVNQAIVAVRELELKPVGVADCSDTPEGQQEDDDGCFEFTRTRGILVIPTESSQLAELKSLVEIPVGQYDRVEFDIFVVDPDDPANSSILDNFPQIAGSAVQVDGIFEGDTQRPFNIGFQLSGDYEFDLPEPILVEEGERGNVTLHIDLFSWFVNQSGEFVDPALVESDPDVRDMVKTNFNQSLTLEAGAPEGIQL